MLPRDDNTAAYLALYYFGFKTPESNLKIHVGVITTSKIRTEGLTNVQQKLPLEAHQAARE
jgi:hypothetical protein